LRTASRFVMPFAAICRCASFRTCGRAGGPIQGSPRPSGRPSSRPRRARPGAPRHAKRAPPGPTRSRAAPQLVAHAAADEQRPSPGGPHDLRDRADRLYRLMSALRHPAHAPSYAMTADSIPKSLVLPRRTVRASTRRPTPRRYTKNVTTLSSFC